MNDFSDLLRADAVSTGLTVASKKALFQQLGTMGSALVDIDARVIAERLGERERLGSTGFGGGVAIPHAKFPELAAPIGLFVRLGQPLEFQAVDDLPVDLVFALLSPVAAGSEHLKALARVSRRMRDRAFLAKLRGAGSKDALYALFIASDARHAA
ncbi:PTS lactose transporter subunit IIC [Sphingomonas sp. Leaf339]|uniref:PTS sugar transporter subunit IIA n=1 Tax=Sphingomonas sp. Leaf339 TaxID=1736343 RepID=UPI0006F56ABE|nr:PTS sugar transporter subunit IIA [Sphingomonas sp. Leaf339]KQU52985.1 PTS lactose transporter subunit IIC [Sphingomonas sp. Leaf339]